MVPCLSDALGRSAVYYSERLKWAEPIDEAELGGSLCQSEQGLTWFKMVAGTRKWYRLAIICTEIQLRLKSDVDTDAEGLTRSNEDKLRSITQIIRRSEWKGENGLLRFRRVNKKAVQPGRTNELRLWPEKNPFLLIITKPFVHKVAGSVQSDNSSFWRIGTFKNWKSQPLLLEQLWQTSGCRKQMAERWWYNSLIRYAYCNTEVSHSWKWPLKVNWNEYTMLSFKLSTF